MPVGTIIFYQFIPLPVTLTFCWGSQGERKAEPLDFIFSLSFQLVRMKFNVVLKQFRLKHRNADFDSEFSKNGVVLLVRFKSMIKINEMSIALFFFFFFFFCSTEKYDALLGDYPILDYARAHLAPSCELKLVSKVFGDDQYGLGLPKNSPLKVGVEGGGGTGTELLQHCLVCLLDEYWGFQIRSVSVSLGLFVG